MAHQEHNGRGGPKRKSRFYQLLAKVAVGGMVFFLAACGAGNDEQEPNSPLTTPMALVVNQDDTTLTTLRLDGKFSPVVGTLSIGPVQPDAIGGVTFSLGEWVFVTHTAGNRVAAIDPIGGSPPILEDFITTNPANALVRVGQRPTKIYRDPVDKEVLWTTNEGDSTTGLDTVAHCPNGGSVSVLHNSHLGVGGGDKPRVTSVACLSGRGEFFVAFAPPPPGPDASRNVFVASKATGIVSLLILTGEAWAQVAFLNLCNVAKELALGYTVSCGLPIVGGTHFVSVTPNHSAPAGLYWSQATSRLYGHLSGYGRVVEYDPTGFSLRTVDLLPTVPVTTVSHVIGMAPDGRELVVIIEDRSDSNHVVTRFATIDVTVSGSLTLTEMPTPTLQDVRVAQFQFTPDGRQLYLLASNDSTGLSSTQANNQQKDLLVILDRNPLQEAGRVLLPAATSHAMDLWITGPAGAGSAKGVVITNATPGVNGTVSLIDPNSGRITSTFRVGRNPKMVTVYYAGLAASDNQAMPRW